MLHVGIGRFPVLVRLGRELRLMQPLHLSNELRLTGLSHAMLRSLAVTTWHQTGL
jgi:hypothetical protein